MQPTMRAMLEMSKVREYNGLAEEASIGQPTDRARVPLLPRLPRFSIRGVCARWTVVPRRANDWELVVLRAERRRALHGVCEQCASAVRECALPPPSRDFVRNDAHPFVVSCTYSSTRSADDRYHKPEINDG